MKKFGIVTDSACDLPSEYRREKGIDYATMMLNWTDKEGKDHETYADLDWEVIKSDEFYNILRSGIRIRTALVPFESYYNVFEKHLKEGRDVLYVACSSGLSASQNIAKGIATEELAKKYPNNRVVVVDTLRAGLAQGMLVMKAQELMEEGKTIDEVKAIIEEIRTEYWEVGFPDTLEYLKRAGRVTGPSAFFGNLFGIKPILVFNKDGMNVAKEKARGRKAALERLGELVKEYSENPENETLYLAHGDIPDSEIEILKAAVEKHVHFKEIVPMILGPIIGASSGPGTVICFFHGKRAKYE